MQLITKQLHSKPSHYDWLVSTLWNIINMGLSDTKQSRLRVYYWNNAKLTCKSIALLCRQGRIQDFKLGGRTLKNCAERKEARKFVGYFMWKITILRKKIIFSNFRGESAGFAPPWIRPWFRSSGLQNHPPTPSTRPSMKNLKTIVDNYNVFQVHYIV
jgi:hypothetical protein